MAEQRLAMPLELKIQACAEHFADRALVARAYPKAHRPPMRIPTAVLALLLLGASAPTKGDYLFVWARDVDGEQTDFLAVVDADPRSPTYSTIVATKPTGERKSGSHHTEHAMPAGGILAANGFGAGKTWLFDLTRPMAPTIRATFTNAGAMMHPHSFVRLPNGNLLATFQMTGHDNKAPGGLAEIDNDGRIIRTSPLTGLPKDTFVRPYSLAIVPALNRVVTTSSDMHESKEARTVEIWRLSDLKYLMSIVLPQGPRAKVGIDPAEPRVLADGKTVMVNTFNCGLYRLDGIAGERPSAMLVHDFVGPGSCALPVVAGRYWVQTNPGLPGLVSLDLSNPSRPKVVSQLSLGKDELPHWIALAPDGRRIVISGGDKAAENQLLMARIDPRNGTLTLDRSFRINFDRPTWPHGDGGKAIPHGAVFSR